MMTKTPLLIITGYLGAGKTTLVKRILEESQRKIAVVMNEFGEINIDGKILGGKNVRMVELLNGCVCCSLTGEFAAALREILETVRPEVIVVETTGVAEPDAMLADLEGEVPEVRVDAVVAVADADALARFPSWGHTAKVQLETADIILLNKVDVVEKSVVRGVQERIKEVNAHALVVQTVRCVVPLELLVGPEVRAPVVVHAEKHPERVESCVVVTEKRVDRAQFEEGLVSLPREVYRVKGVACFADGCVLVNGVAGRFESEPFEGTRTELVFVGKDVKKVEPEIRRRLGL